VFILFSRFPCTIDILRSLISGQPFGVGIPTQGIVQQAGIGQTVSSQYQTSEAPAVQWQIHGTSDVSEFLHTMNKERMHLENQLGREEETTVHKVLKEQVRISQVELQPRTR
jgi:hypothetical protein